VVGLRQHGEAVAAVEALDNPHLPERLVPVEALAEDAAREAPELLLGARLGEGRVADVVAQVEVRVVDPARPALAERDERELLAVARHEVQARPDPLDHLVDVRRLAVERHDGSHVHV
jgi:hypothetical protein